MNRPDQTVIAGRVTFDRDTHQVLVRRTDGGPSSAWSEDAERLRAAVAGLERARGDAARALVVAECAMGNVARQHGLPWSVRSITQP